MWQRKVVNPFFEGICGNKAAGSYNGLHVFSEQIPLNPPLLKGEAARFIRPFRFDDDKQIN